MNSTDRLSLSVDNYAYTRLRHLLKTDLFDWVWRAYRLFVFALHNFYSYLLTYYSNAIIRWLRSLFDVDVWWSVFLAERCNRRDASFRYVTRNKMSTFITTRTDDARSFPGYGRTLVTRRREHWHANHRSADTFCTASSIHIVGDLVDSQSHILGFVKAP